jgi:hypothetical protein
MARKITRGVIYPSFELMERTARVIEAVERERMVGSPSRPVKIERMVAARAVRTANTGVHAI